MATLPLGMLSGTREVRYESLRGSHLFTNRLGPRYVNVKLEKSDLVRSPPDSSWYRKPTSYSCSVGPAVAYGDYSGSVVYRDAKATASGRLPFTPLSDPVSLDFGYNQDQALRTKLLNNIHDEVLDVGMVLAEMQSTVSTAVTSLDRIARSLDAFARRKPESFYYLLYGRRRDNRRPTDRFLRQTASEYLNWKYGIMPSVYDLAGACRGLDMNAEGSLWNNPPLLVARATILKETVTKPIDFGNGWQWPFGVECRVVREHKARCDYKISGEGIRGLNRYGIGLTTLPTILFERTPFSFVLNMAMPIAELIKAWGALAGVDVVGYCETKYARCEPLGGSAAGMYSDSWQRIEFSKGSIAMRMQRTAFSEPPMPMPFVRNPINTGNLATVLALFTSLRSAS